MTRALLALLVGFPLLLSLFATGATLFGLVRRGFDAWLVALAVFFGSLAAFLVSILVSWMRRPHLELTGGTLSETETRTLLVRVLLSVAISAMLIAILKELVPVR